MNQLQNVFNYEGRQVRTVMDETGNPWFVAKDVCDVLAVSNPTDALKRLDADERTLVSIEGASNGLPVNAVNESGLYSLILGSRKPEAKAFKRWVTHEVLPTIRKTGRYEVVEKQPSYMIDDRIQRAERWIEEERERQQLAEQVAVTAPKVEAFDTLMSADNALAVGEVAKVLQCPGVGPRNLFDFLRKERFLISPGRLPYQEHVEAGLFRVVNTTYQCDGETLMSTKTLVTAKGIEKIRQRLVERGMYEKQRKSA
ncbi:MAG TPA: BRO family protein [Bacilli bacterium]|nr:BRO family protein [Bacilli bacterium]